MHAPHDYVRAVAGEVCGAPLVNLPAGARALSQHTVRPKHGVQQGGQSTHEWVVHGGGAPHAMGTLHEVTRTEGCNRRIRHPCTSMTRQATNSRPRRQRHRIARG
jgi:hypothetical protein